MIYRGTCNRNRNFNNNNNNHDNVNNSTGNSNGNNNRYNYNQRGNSNHNRGNVGFRNIRSNNYINYTTEQMSKPIPAKVLVVNNDFPILVYSILDMDLIIRRH